MSDDSGPLDTFADGRRAETYVRGGVQSIFSRPLRYSLNVVLGHKAAYALRHRYLI